MESEQRERDVVRFGLRKKDRVSGGSSLSSNGEEGKEGGRDVLAYLVDACLRQPPHEARDLEHCIEVCQGPCGV